MIWQLTIIVFCSTNSRCGGGVTEQCMWQSRGLKSQNSQVCQKPFFGILWCIMFWSETSIHCAVTAIQTPRGGDANLLDVMNNYRAVIEASNCDAPLSRVVYIYVYHHHHHHTMQVTMCAYSFVHTLVNALVLQGKTSPAQVAVEDNHHECKCSIFASWWKEKHHQRKLHSVKTILGASIGVGCSNEMQVAQGHDLGGALLQAAFGCCIPLLYLRPRWSRHCATCTGAVFPWSTSAFTNACTKE